jgi:hypothetical protein
MQAGKGLRILPRYAFLPGSNRGQLTRFRPVSQVGAINLETVADHAGANRSGIDPVD